MRTRSGQLRGVFSFIVAIALIAALFSACAGAPVAAKENEAAARSKVIIQSE